MIGSKVGISLFKGINKRMLDCSKVLNFYYFIYWKSTMFFYCAVEVVFNIY